MLRWLVACLLCSWVSGGSWCSWANAAEPADLHASVSERFTGYLDAFNAGDADKVAGYWADDAVSLDEETGERAVGRDAILKDFKAFFEGAPNAKLVGRIDEVREIHPEVAIAEGMVTLYAPGAEPVPSVFTVVLVKESDQWFIESSQERDLPSPATPHDALQDLAWLIGDWRDDSDEVDVSTTVRWSPNEAFLIRSFRADYGDGEPFEGTQVIGWDPAAKQFRTWTFNSDGSFGEGTVSRSGEDWLIKMSHVSNDGGASSGTQVITRVDADTMRVEKIGHTVDGAPAPKGDAVTVVRIPADEDEETPAGGE